jgi:hypothetical protein
MYQNLKNASKYSWVFIFVHFYSIILFFVSFIAVYSYTFSLRVSFDKLLCWYLLSSSFEVRLVSRVKANQPARYYLVNTWCTVLLSMFISFLYMFRATMCPSSGEVTVSMRHLAFVTLCGWLSGMQGGTKPCIPDSHPHRVTNTKRRIDTFICPDDGHFVARNM